MQRAFHSFLDGESRAVLAAFLEEKNVTLAPPVGVVLLGVWDTVLALGSPFGKGSADLTREREMCIGPRPASLVRHARQGIAIDEERADFTPEIWESADHGEQTLRQCWLSGAHSDIGDSDGHDGLANIALHWIADEARELVLALDQTFLNKYRPYAGDERHDSSGRWFRLMDRLRNKDGRRVIPLHMPDAQFRLSPLVLGRIRDESPDGADADAPYRPATLIDYLRSTPTPTPRSMRSAFQRTSALSPRTSSKPATPAGGLPTAEPPKPERHRKLR